MKQYQYITKDGRTATVAANNPQEAMSKAVDINPQSGVRELSLGGGLPDNTGTSGTQNLSLSNNDTNKSSGSIVDFSNALDQATNLARNNRNALSLGIMSPFSGTLAASDFNSILSGFNKASEKNITSKTESVLPDISNASVELRTFATLRPDLKVGTPEFQTEFEKYTQSQKTTKDTTNQPLSILDVARYNELYPDAGITAGDTEATANTKVNQSNSPEATTRRLVIAAQANGATYDTIVNEINNDGTITDKEKALQIVDEVYDIQKEPPIYSTKKNFTDVEINDRAQELLKIGFDGVAIRRQLIRDGYDKDAATQVANKLSTNIQAFTNTISNYLFGE